MAEHMENPFEDYKLPERVGIFSFGCKMLIIGRKAQQIADRTRQTMLEGDNLDEFFAGNIPAKLDYDYSSLDLFLYDEVEQNLDFVSKSMAAGLRQACYEKDQVPHMGPLVVAYVLTPEDSNVARIIISPAPLQ